RAVIALDDVVRVRERRPVDLVAAEVEVVVRRKLVEEELGRTDYLFRPGIDGEMRLRVFGIEVAGAWPYAAARHGRALGISASAGGRADHDVCRRDRRQP